MVEHKCGVCDKSFSSKEALEMHSQAKHEAAKPRKPYKIKIKYFVYLIILIGLLGIVYWWYSAATGPGKYDDFAKCITGEETKMYGAYWCPHCANQKNIFGKSFDYVDYVECSLPNKAGQTQVCKDANIQSYPTWEFKDGSRLSGELSLKTLSEQTGCSI